MHQDENQAHTWKIETKSKCTHISKLIILLLVRICRKFYFYFIIYKSREIYSWEKIHISTWSVPYLHCQHILLQYHIHTVRIFWIYGSMSWRLYQKLYRRVTMRSHTMPIYRFMVHGVYPLQKKILGWIGITSYRKHFQKNKPSTQYISK